MNARQLASRDPARAALMGAISGASFGFGADYGASRVANSNARPRDFSRPSVGFGDDYGFGDAYGFGDEAGFGDAYGFGDEAGFGDEYGFGAAVKRRRGIRPPAAGPKHMGAGLHPAAKAHAWATSPQNPSSTASRTRLLDPNRDSLVKVTGYSFSFSPVTSLILGTASSLGTFTQQPSTSIKGRRVLTNAPIPGFVLLTALQIANVNVFVGTTEDAFTYNAGAQNVIMDLPRLDPQNRATASGSYTGALPPGYTSGAAYQFVITLQGPSTLAGGYGQ